MKIRLTVAPWNLVRLQIDDQVTYIRRKDEARQGNSRANRTHPSGPIPLVNGDEPVFDVDGCKIYVQSYPDRTDVIVVKTFLQARVASAA